jgi:hypothetical protein
MRKADAAGLDAPAIWKTGSVCVETNETVSVTINGGAPIPAGVNDIKAVIYWYDRRHEVGTDIDDVDLYLRRTDGTTLRESISNSDNKERVYHGAIAGNAVRLDIHGYAVGADNEGCGANSMLLYYAYFYEDDARDDPDGPGFEIDPE